MRLPMVMGSFAACALLLGTAGPSAAACDPDGDVQFVCGPANPEDLVPIPQSPWVVVSSLEDEGYLHLIDSRDHSSTVLFPSETARPRHDTAMYGACPGPSTDQFGPHGLNLRPGANGVHTLYVVRHGSRESVEIFELDTRRGIPTVTWIGCVVAPESVGANSVAALPGGGFAVTNFRRRGDPQAQANLLAGETTGEVWEWHPDAGWTMVPGSDTSGPNGLEVSRDGQWFYIGGWGTHSLIRLSRGRTPVQKDAVEVGFHIDNVHWAPDGSLLAAGHSGSAQAVLTDCLGQRQCSEVTTRVAKIDPDTLRFQEIVHYPSNDLVILGTAAATGLLDSRRRRGRARSL